MLQRWRMDLRPGLQRYRRAYSLRSQPPGGERPRVGQRIDNPLPELRHVSETFARLFRTSFAYPPLDHFVRRMLKQKNRSAKWGERTWNRLLPAKLPKVTKPGMETTDLYGKASSVNVQE